MCQLFENVWDMWKCVHGILSYVFPGDLQIFLIRMKRFIYEWRPLHWKYIKEILLQLAQGKVELSVAIMWNANSRKCKKYI